MTTTCGLGPDPASTSIATRACASEPSLISMFQSMTGSTVCEWFDTVPETLSRTSLGDLEEGSRVNLEPSVRAGEPLGGHYVQGHVDGVCRVRSIERDGVGLRVSFEASPGLLRYVVEKGSVAVHGVALTVTAVDDETFGVALIPHTLAETTLGTIAVGDELNLEVDVLGKYVERLMAGGIPSPQ